VRVNTAFFLLTLLAQTSTETWVNSPRPLQVGNLNQSVDPANAAVYKNGAAQLIRETIGIEPRNLTYVIHVARWSDEDEIVKQHWYVFQAGAWSDAQFATANRIYGRRQIWFLYIQLNTRSNPTYTIQTTKKTAAYFEHLQTAAGLFGLSVTPMVGEARNVWNAMLVDIPYVPSTIVITAEAGGAATFDDEGLSSIDFSAAVPLKGSGMFALADLYVPRVDINSAMGFGNWTHLVGGVRVGSQPLKNILVGVGWGPIYGGVAMGNGAYTFSFGVNISASAAVAALKK
jgi:hypothetical protein